MRLAKRRSTSGGITSSFCATAYQVGMSFFHAGAPHHFLEGGNGEGLLYGIHDVRFNRINIRRKVLHEIVLGKPGEALVVDTQMRDRRSWLTLREQRADRLAFIKAEARDVHQSDNIRSIRPERGHDLTPIGMSGNKGRARIAAASTCRSRATLASSVVSGNCGAVTLYPAFCRSLMTPLQLEPSAQAPCTRTMFG